MEASWPVALMQLRKFQIDEHVERNSRMVSQVIWPIWDPNSNGTE
jgi:hypothetical protein